MSELIQKLDNGNDRCQGTTKSGSQCKKAAEEGREFCGQHKAPDGQTDPAKLPDEIVQAEAELNDPQFEKFAKAKARREKKAAARVSKHGHVVGTETIERGEVMLNLNKGAKRRQRKAALRAKRDTQHASQVRGAKLAQARAKALRADARYAARLAAKKAS